jgi:hypothetical protein
MKKSLTGVVALLAGAFVAHSQTTGTVAFANYGSGGGASSYIYVSLGSTKLGSTTPVTTPIPPTAGNFAQETGNGDDWTVALFGAAGSGDAASSLLPLNTPGGTPLTANLADGGQSDDTPGTWYSGASGAVPGTFNGQAATVQVYAWYNEGGTVTTYAAAKAAGLPTGFSAPANVTSLGGAFQGGTAPPGFPANLPTGLGNITLTGGSVLPEPSTVALGVMGASAFLLRLRKKQ